MRIAESLARLLIEHVLLDRSVLQQLYAMLEMGAFVADRIEFRLKLCGSRFEMVPRFYSEFAMIGMVSEIGEENGSNRGDDQRSRFPVPVLAGPERTLTLPHDAAPDEIRMPPIWTNMLKAWLLRSQFGHSGADSLRIVRPA